MRRQLPLAAAGCALLAACGAQPASPGPTAAAADALAGARLTVLAASSLTDALEDADATLRTSHAGFSGSYSFAGSQQLVAQVKAGAPADVVITADTVSMQALVGAGLVDTPVVVARNTMAIAVAPGNPRAVHGLADLARGDVAVVLADTSVPAGRLARQALAKAHVTVTPRSNEPDVRTALQRVESGDADAAIVYVTDTTAAGSAVEAVPIAGDENVVTEYVAAVVRSGDRRGAAAAFVADARSGTVAAALRRRGFAAP